MTDLSRFTETSFTGAIRLRSSFFGAAFALRHYRAKRDAARITAFAENLRRAQAGTLNDIRADFPNTASAFEKRPAFL